MPHHVTACQVMSLSRYVTACQVMSLSPHVTLRHVASCRMARHVRSCHVTSRPIPACHGMACHVMPRQCHAMSLTSRRAVSCRVSSGGRHAVSLYRSLSQGVSHGEYGCYAGRGPLRVSRGRGRVPSGTWLYRPQCRRRSIQECGHDHGCACALPMVCT